MGALPGFQSEQQPAGGMGQVIVAVIARAVGEEVRQGVVQVVGPGDASPVVGLVLWEMEVYGTPS